MANIIDYAQLTGVTTLVDRLKFSNLQTVGQATGVLQVTENNFIRNGPNISIDNAPDTIVQRNINGVIKANTTTQPLGTSNGSLASTSFVNQTVNSSLVPIQNDIRVLSEDMAGANAFLSGSISTLQGQVTTLQGQVRTLQGQVTTLQGQVTTLQNGLQELDYKVEVYHDDQVYANVTFTRRLNDLEAYTGSDIPTLQSQVTTLQGQVTTLQNGLQDLDNTVQVFQADQAGANTNFTNRLDQLDSYTQSTIPALESQVGSKSGGVSRFYMSTNNPDNQNGEQGDMVFVYDPANLTTGTLYVCVQSYDPTASPPLYAIWLQSSFSP